MKAFLDRDGCISCSVCVETCPEVFRMAQDGIAEVYKEDVPSENLEKAIEAQESCPVSVIKVEK
jgi:ferredoxin